MKNISLKSIRIHNFKGISDLMIEPNGKSIDILETTMQAKQLSMMLFFGACSTKIQKNVLRFSGVHLMKIASQFAVNRHQ